MALTFVRSQSWERLDSNPVFRVHLLSGGDAFPFQHQFKRTGIAYDVDAKDEPVLFIRWAVENGHLPSTEAEYLVVSVYSDGSGHVRKVAVKPPSKPASIIRGVEL